MSKPNKRRVKWLKKIKANPRRITPTVPGKETDFIWEDDPKEVETMRNERHRQNSLAKLRKLEALWREERIRMLQRMIDEDLAAIKKLS